MVINPRKVIDLSASYIGIFLPEKSSATELQMAFHVLLAQSVFNDQLDDYYLSRVDLWVNIRCDHKKIFREVVRVLQKLPTPPKYKRVSHKKKTNRHNRHYIKFQCGTHSLVIYDNTYQMTDRGLRVDYEDLPEGVLRFEVQYPCSVLRGLEKKLDTDNPSALLWHLMQQSEIGKGLLSLALEFGEVRIARCLSGQIPSKEYSDIMRTALSSPALMKNKLEQNKNKI